MYDALKDTLNPKGGHGMSETVLAIILIDVVIAVIIFNYLGIEIDPILDFIIKSGLGLLVGRNIKEKDKNQSLQELDFDGDKGQGGEK